MSLLALYFKALSYLKEEKTTSFIICFINLLLALSAILEPILFGHVIASMSDLKDKHTLFMTVALWLGFSMFSAIGFILVARASDRLAHRRRLAFLRESFGKILSMPLAWHQKLGSSNALHILLRASDTLSSLWLNFMRQHLATLAALALLLPTAFTMDWHLALILILLGTFYSLFSHFIITKTETRQQALEKAHHNVFEHISDCISNVKTIQSYNRVEKELTTLQFYTQSLLALQYPVLNWWAFASACNRIISTVAVGAVLLLSTFLLEQGTINVGQIITFIGFAQLMISRIEQLISFVTSTASSRPALEEFFSLEQQIILHEEPKNLPNLRVTSGEILIKNLDFTFSGGKKILHNISLHVKRGQTLALIGPTGAGKTTLINILQRVYDCAPGHVFIDSMDITKVNKRSLRASIATVSQNTQLLKRSIAANILLANDEASEEELYQSAKKAAAHAFIIEKKLGYDEPVGEGGNKLSGGEKQRLSLAAALLKNAPILILDEATSSLDVETESFVKNELDKITKDKTTIVIAHRLSTVQNADIVLFLDQGRVIEYGNFAEIAQRGGRLSSLLELAGIKI